MERIAATVRELREDLPAARISEPPLWPILVRRVAAALRNAGCQPTANKRGHDDAPGRPAWFQQFMRDLNEVLPADLKRKEQSREAKAFYDAVAKALHAPVSDRREHLLAWLQPSLRGRGNKAGNSRT